MRRDASWAGTALPTARAKSASSSIACLVFVVAMGAAFWAGALWATHSWLP
ncbi:MAG: hypothetical protein ACHP84_01280 [Caulobacterales bacterium]